MSCIAVIRIATFLGRRSPSEPCRDLGATSVFRGLRFSDLDSGDYPEELEDSLLRVGD